MPSGILPQGFCSVNWKDRFYFIKCNIGGHFFLKLYLRVRERARACVGKKGRGERVGVLSRLSAEHGAEQGSIS